ncbi:MAG: MATE family efflux transporter [Deferribacterales bacterium]|nr:MATE family efflux transporter [Deferribacterales bacterium]
MTLHEKIYIVKQKFKNELKSLELPKLLKQSWSMSWPMIIIMFFEFIMNLTDVYIAGLMGKEVKAAVGLSTQVYSFFIMAGHAITVGTVSVVSRLYSDTDKNAFKQAVFTAVSSSWAAGAVIGTLGIIFAPWVITILNAPESVKSYGVTLLRIYSLGVFFHMVLINMNGVLRSCRKMKATMYVMVLAAVLNIIFNVNFLKFTELGFKGIAISTAISVFIAFCIDLIIIYKILDKTYIFSKYMLKQILSIGWPSGIVSISWQLGATMLFVILAMLPNSVEVMAAYTTGLRIESAIFMPAFAFNMANAVIVGNLMGEKRFRDAYRAGIVTAVMSVTVISVMAVIVVLNARPIAEILDSNLPVIDEVMKYLYICMVSEPFIALNLAMGGALNGAGDTKATMRYAVTTVWLIRIPLSYLLGIFIGFGSTGIWWALNIGFFIHAALSTRRFISKKWQKATV